MRDPHRMIEPLLAIAGKAGRVIMDIYGGEFSVIEKGDRSPVTKADQLAEEVILRGLAELSPGIEVIAEEKVAAYGLPKDVPDIFWLVDPLDGTKEFLKKNGEFTVNIALIKKGQPVLGVIHIPADQSYYWNCGNKAFRKHEGGTAIEIRARIIPEEGATMISSRSHGGEDFSGLFPDTKISNRAVAGSSLKFCRLAEGKADLYPRLKPTMEWDIAAGHAILQAAGGAVSLLDGRHMTYGKAGFMNPHFIARGI